MDYGKEAGIFNRFTLSPQEEKDGKLLNDFQRAVLHNMRADIVQNKLSLIFTPENIVNYAQQEACLTGQIALLDIILADSLPEITTEFNEE